MPVTAELSRLFYERVGAQVANEVVEWFNVLDQTSRSDLREMNELNFARFDAKLEQRVAQLDGKLSGRHSAPRSDGRDRRPPGARRWSRRSAAHLSPTRSFASGKSAMRRERRCFVT